VGKHAVPIRWQYWERDEWREFQVTHHTIYTVLKLPSEPWQQTDPAAGGDNIQLPWVTALDLACAWAKGATSLDSTARMITEGLNGSPLFAYITDEQFSSDEAFRLSDLLRSMERNDPIKVNCIDCSYTVMALANILGCNLYAKRINAGPRTRSLLPIGGVAANPDHWIQEDSLSRHQVAWIQGPAVDGWVFDACYRLDLDLIADDDDVHVPHLATGMNFRAYRSFLVGQRSPAKVEESLRRPRVV